MADAHTTRIAGLEQAFEAPAAGQGETSVTNQCRLWWIEPMPSAHGLDAQLRYDTVSPQSELPLDPRELVCMIRDLVVFRGELIPSRWIVAAAATQYTGVGRRPLRGDVPRHVASIVVVKSMADVHSVAEDEFTLNAGRTLGCETSSAVLPLPPERSRRLVMHLPLDGDVAGAKPRGVARAAASRLDPFYIALHQRSGALADGQYVEQLVFSDDLS